MTDPIIGIATVADVPELTRLVNGAYRGDSSRQGWTTEADLLSGLRTTEADLYESLANPQAQMLTYRAEGRLLGCVYLERKEAELYLGMLTVSPDFQTEGIGKRLLGAAEDVAKNFDCQTITMTVISQRPELIAWYERRGYQSTGATKPFPDDPRFGVLAQPLTFIVMAKAVGE